MGRLTEANKLYNSLLLRRLQAFEDLGFEPNQITPKKGSAAAKNRHEVELTIKTRKGGNGCLYEIVMDGRKMTSGEFAAAVKINPNTIRSWINNDTFYEGLRKRGIIL
ncbi:hypothetical protein [Anaerotignum sp. MB30-C6]|uniref:hypothetical protein n=1 Tax=Anaerotignum sp. MB30-C6 TaxID=3070814 RepID=UPI0027DB1424|nr:hypothetical protein [Anaerotignum sp. MB30-C6]WMI81815.1 hypothetical protein RBQ60_03560 [Anaerotignum sp. MB30-C6]WMI81914.1 hypothetical protein RBQ60_04070 [Anaerotignum sp. MB30-C6]